MLFFYIPQNFFFFTSRASLEANTRLKQQRAQGKSDADAWNNASQLLVQAALVWLTLVMMCFRFKLYFMSNNVIMFTVEETHCSFFIIWNVWKWSQVLLKEQFITNFCVKYERKLNHWTKHIKWNLLSGVNFTVQIIVIMELLKMSA